MIVISAASGKLGQATAGELIKRVPISEIRFAARTPLKLEAWKSRGAAVVQADYDDPASLDATFAGAELVFLISSDGKVAYVTHVDIAAAAAAVLTQPGHENKTYELTGTEALDGFEIAAVISQTASREIKAANPPPEDAAAHFRSMGLPEFAVEGLLSMYAAAEAGEYATVTHDVETLSGRPAESVRAHIQAVAG